MTRGPRETTGNAEVLADLARIITSSPSIADVYESSAAVIRRILPFDRLSVAMIDTEGETARAVYTYSQIDIDTRRIGDRFQLMGSLCGAVLATGAGMVVRDAAGPEAEQYAGLKPLVAEGMRSFLAVPLRVGGRTFAVLTAGSRHRYTYGHPQLSIAQSIADQIAGAVLNAQLYADAEVARREASRLMEEAGLLAEICRLARSSLELPEVYQRAASRLRDMIPYDLVQISLVDNNREQIQLAYREGNFPLNPVHHKVGRWRLEGSLADVAIRSGRAVSERVRDPEESLRKYPLLEWSIQQGFRSIMVAPLRAQGHVFGVVHFLSLSAEAYDARHVRLVERFADQIAPAIENARLFEEARRDAEERAALAEIGRIATSSISVADVYARCAEQIKRLLPFDRLSVATIDSGSGVARVEYMYPANEEHHLSVGTGFELAGSLSGAVASDSRGLMIDAADATVAAKYPAIAALIDAGFRSFITAPMRSGGRTIGALGASATATGAFTDRHLLLAQQVADQLAGPVANAGLFESAEQGRRENQMLAAVGRIVGSSLDSQEVYRQCADRLRLVIPFHTFAIVMVDRQQQQRRIEYWEGMRLIGIESAMARPLEGTITGKAFATGRAVLELVEDVDDTLRRFPGVDTSVHAGCKSMLCAPLRVADRLIGAIHLRSFDRNAYSGRHLELIERFAAQIAPAIENAYLHEAMTRQAEQRALVAEERARRVVLEAERDELQRTSEARKKLLTLVSHELKTPLTVTKAFLELLKKNRTGNLSERQIRQLDSAFGSTQHLEMIVNDLLDLSRLDAGNFRLVTRDFNMASLVAETAATMQPIFDTRSQKVEVDVGRASDQMFGDPDRLEQVISNLLSNASKFSPRESVIDLRAWRGPSGFVIEITDRGIGIAPHDEALLFKPFMRADNAQTRAVPGTGLGLYISSSIVRLHGGTIGVRSAPGSGSTFIVELPAAVPGRNIGASPYET